MNFQTKQNVKKGKITPKEAYDRLYPLVGEQYSHLLPTMKWLKRLAEGKKMVQKTTEKLEKKIEFRKKKHKK